MKNMSLNSRHKRIENCSLHGGNIRRGKSRSQNKKKIFYDHRMPKCDFAIKMTIFSLICSHIISDNVSSYNIFFLSRALDSPS